MTDPVPAPPVAAPKTPVFRWKNIIPAASVTALLVLFSVFFLDWTVKALLEKAGTTADGAKVELDGVRISLLHLGVTLTGLQVTDAKDPMTNTLEVGRMTFKLAPKPLFWKKIIIEDASIAGIRTGTPRKRSGALAGRPSTEKKGKPGAPGEAKAPGAAPPASSFDELKKKFDPKSIKLEDLESYKKIKEEQVHWTAAAGSWQSRVDAVRVDDREKEVKAFVDKVKGASFSGAEGLKKAKELLKEGKKLKDDLQSTQKGFNEVKKDLGDEIGRAKGALKEIDDLKKKDADGALGDLKDNFSAEGIVRGLVGPAWMGKIETGLAWFHKVRSMIPQQKKGEKPPPPPARDGKDIPFPFKYNWPAFLLKKASLSGETPGGLAYSGSLKDVTSDPKKWGRPIALDLAGKKGAEALSLRAELDYTKDVAREKVQFSYGGFPLAGVKLGDVSGPVTLAQGAGKTTGDLETRGEQIAGRIDFLADPVKLSHAPAGGPPKDKLGAALHDTLTGVKKLDVTFLVSDKVASPDIKVRSSLDNQIAGALKAAVQKQLDDLRAQAQARVNELTGGEQKKLSDTIDGGAGDAAKKMGLKDKQLQGVQDQLQKALAGMGGKEALPGGGNPSLKKLFKKK